MNCYFEEGEVFTWIRDRERSGENMVVSLKMLKECHRTVVFSLYYPNLWRNA